MAAGKHTFRIEKGNYWANNIKVIGGDNVGVAMSSGMVIMPIASAEGDPSKIIDILGPWNDTVLVDGDTTHLISVVIGGDKSAKWNFTQGYYALEYYGYAASTALSLDYQVAAYTSAALVDNNGSAQGTITANSGTPFTMFAAGDRILISNANTAANNGYYLVVSQTGTPSVLTLGRVLDTTEADTGLQISKVVSARDPNRAPITVSKRWGSVDGSSYKLGDIADLPNIVFWVDVTDGTDGLLYIRNTGDTRAHTTTIFSDNFSAGMVFELDNHSESTRDGVYIVQEVGSGGTYGSYLKIEGIFSGADGFLDKDAQLYILESSYESVTPASEIASITFDADTSSITADSGEPFHVIANEHVSSNLVLITCLNGGAGGPTGNNVTGTDADTDEKAWRVLEASGNRLVVDATLDDEVITTVADIDMALRKLSRNTSVRLLEGRIRLLEKARSGFPTIEEA